ncbi:peptidase C13 family-domain-containing protein [Dactylonectria macrodidyma]|uniref:Peptidase C13 family-domain-containing protein n=1 Tax=Dactylonectria macrodidyma TaxID=307937 RepID=A0A9P9FLS1_9HYPO|nr:peptidase C13 family-domain-containing protein [Dactylonectria macrodidyma]
MNLSILRFHALVAAALFATAAIAEHTSNWAVLVCTSRFWFNYRHLANVLSMYRTVKRLGIPDSQIILMLPDDMACNPRNAFPGTVYSNSDRAVDLYGDNIEVDYRGYEVTVENFIRLLTDRVGAEMPRSKRLLTDDRSNILVYMTGHGGNEFLKFQDAEEIGAVDLANAFEEMWEKKRYHEILFMIDTCQANTMYSRLYSPNIIATGSSELDQSSYSHHADNDVGVAVIDRYTYYNLEFLETQVKDLGSRKTVGDLFDSYDYGKIHSNPGFRYDLFPGGPDSARSRLITDFFGNVQNVEVDRINNLTLEEDLLELSKKIALLKQREAEADASQKEHASVSASEPTEAPRKVQKAKALTDDNWWTKKVVGATALAGCALLWGLGSLLEAIRVFRASLCTRPLKTIHLKSRPLTSHALAWSCDAELAVATDDTIYIFLPEYPKVSDRDEATEEETHQFSLSFRASGLIRPDPTINAQLCAFAGIRVVAPRTTEENWFTGVGNGLVTSSGASVCQIIRLEWSPKGLGCNLRPVLTALSTNGAIITIGEHIDRQSTVISGMRTRGFKAWKTLWGLGAQLPLPDLNEEGGYRNMNERIKAFSWAKEVSNGRALLAYCNDAEEIAIMGVQLFSRPKPSESAVEEAMWDIQELGRFDGRGLHTKEDATDITDPDFVPHGSAFSVKWSPWLISKDKRIAILAYLAKNYVGFRRITIQGDWIKGQLPRVSVEDADVTNICTFLSTDAIIEWEDSVNMEGGDPVARGVLGTPFDVKPFQVSYTAPPQEVREPHYTWECSTAYPKEEEHISKNPITGLVMHRQDQLSNATVPYYSLVRLSATASNHDWYQTNLPDTGANPPQWAGKIKKNTTRLISRASALEGLDSDSDDSEDEPMDEGESKLQVHQSRFRIWGMATSPGGGSTVTLVSQFSTLHPERRAISKLMFGWRDETEIEEVKSSKELSTEGQLWEWMYGGGSEVPGTTVVGKMSTGVRDSPLREQFKEVIAGQRCVFCDSTLQTEGHDVKCENGHSFARCASTALAIMGPDISRMCAVCELRCLKVSELSKIAEECIGPGTRVESSGEVCGGCGGKFVA